MEFFIRRVLYSLASMSVAVCALGCNSMVTPEPPALAVVLDHSDAAVLTSNTRTTPSCTSGSATNVANCEFALLTHATVTWTGRSQERPVWVSWADKCDLGLVGSDGCAHPPGVCGSNPLHSHSRPFSDYLSLARPVQALPRNKNHLAERSSPPLPELSSVLFSPEICNEAKYLNNANNLKSEIRNASHQGVPDPEVSPSRLLSNSTVIKLVWEIVIPGIDFYSARIFDPAERAAYGNGPKLAPLSLWTVQYKINGDESVPCKDALDKPGNGPNAPTISINCFYHCPVDMSNPQVRQVIDQNPSNIPTQHIPGGAKGFVILVAMHAMVFHPNHPLWEWMTYYWTPQVNRSWKSPWNHYATSTMNPPVAGKPIYPVSVANPYLEGNIDVQGMNTNCVSCHSLAAYNGGNNPTRVSLSSAIITKSPNYPKSEQEAITSGYFTSSIRTHFLWSIVNNPTIY